MNAQEKLDLLEVQIANLEESVEMLSDCAEDIRGYTENIAKILRME